MDKWTDSIDHLDPIWKEGRDYQLVCGMVDNPLNHRLCSVGENSRKSNRFVPWRVDRRLPPPEELGDWAWFLNLETNEWELCQWLGARWYELTRCTCAEHFSGLSRRGVPLHRDPSIPSNFVEYHRRRISDKELNEKHIETCRKNGQIQGPANGRKNKGRKHSPEINAKKGSPGQSNPMYGVVRITNGSVNTQIPKGDPVPEGYWPGITRRKA